MAILFTVISRGTTVLARHANCAGNFNEVVEQILCKISPENAKMSYTHGSYFFHYVSYRRIIYLCITEDDFERSRAFAYLKYFIYQFTERIYTALAFSMNSEFSSILAARMRHHSSGNKDQDRLEEIQQEADEIKTIMVRNIDSVAARGERLELLIDKTEDLSANAVAFKKSSRQLERSMWWKNIKITLVVALVVIILLYFIVCIACGGLAWQNCVKH